MNSLDKLFSFNQNALNIRAQRQEILAANIANSDTPNYKARDIDFSTALKDALSASQTSANQSQTPSAKVLYRESLQGSVDGNTVDSDVERNIFTENAIQYETNLTLIKADARDLLTALQP